MSHAPSWSALSRACHLVTSFIPNLQPHCNHEKTKETQVYDHSSKLLTSTIQKCQGP